MFDFWGVKTHQQWMNGGKFDGGQLNETQKYLRDFYKDLNKLVNTSEAIQSGKFFDLQYIQHEGYNRRKVYSYLRHTDNQRMLFVCNFDNQHEQNLNIVVPEGAWTAMGLEPKGTYVLKGIFNQKSQRKINASEAIEVRVAPNSVAVFEIKTK
jgi:hypothetical protein